MVEECALLKLYAEIDNGHIGVVERVQGVRLTEIQFFKLRTRNGDSNNFNDISHRIPDDDVGLWVRQVDNLHGYAVDWH